MQLVDVVNGSIIGAKVGNDVAGPVGAVAGAVIGALAGLLIPIPVRREILGGRGREVRA